MLVGQANVAIRYSRRVEVVHALVNNMREAQELVTKYDHLLKDKELFGRAFHKKVEKEKARSATSGLLSLDKQVDKRISHNPQQHQNQPNQQGSSRGQTTHGGQKCYRKRYRSNRPGLGQAQGRAQGQGTGRGAGWGRGKPRYVTFSVKSVNKVKHDKCNRSSCRKCTFMLIPESPSLPRIHRTPVESPLLGRSQTGRTHKERFLQLEKLTIKPINFRHSTGLQDKVHLKTSTKLKSF